MKITHLKTFIVYAYRTNWVFVKLYTDAGIEGVGEGTVEYREQTVAKAIEELGRYLIGKDPFAVEYHCEMMNRDSYWRSGVILRSAISAVEAAMLDIKGKALGVPVYELLGGKYRDSVKAYANGWFARSQAPAEFGQKARQTIDELGFRVLKFDPFGAAYMGIERSELRRSLEKVEAVRSAIGDDNDLIVEAHGRFDAPTAIWVGNAIRDYDPLWYEEPVPPESLVALGRVRSHCPVPIAVGERCYDRFGFEEILRQQVADILQPDVSHVGGILECKRVAAMAQTHYLPISAHNPSGPVAHAMTLHVAASTPNYGLLEMMSTDVPWRHEIVDEQLELVDGYMVIPDRPGLGVELNEEAALKYPYQPRDLRHYVGTLTNIRPDDAVPYYKITRTEESS